MTRSLRRLTPLVMLLVSSTGTLFGNDDGSPAGLAVRWADNFLTIRGPQLPGGELRIWYMEAYCRPGSTDRAWNETVIGHKTELVSASDDGKRVDLRCTLKDGVIVNHEIRAGIDDVDFRITASNPSDKVS